MKCRRAVIDLPLRLTLTLLILSLSLPLADAALQMQERDAAMRECGVQAEALLDTATVVYFQGGGSSRHVPLTLPSSTSLTVTEGGLIIEHEGKALGTVMANNPSFPLFHDHPITLKDGDMVELTAVEREGIHGVMVRIL